jgi:hypothetical protein
MKPGPKRKYTDAERRARANEASKRSRARRLARDPAGYKKAIRVQTQRLYARHGAQIKFRVQLRKHNLTAERFAAMLATQNERCEICATRMEPPCVDHDHRCCPGEGSCGKCVRGLLCGSCNKLLGFAKENLTVLEGAAAYLRKPRNER